MIRLDQALLYAGWGWPVVPVHCPAHGGCSCRKRACKHVGKHPRVKGGVHAATTDTRQIEVWHRRWPDANIGVATGAASGLVVLDQDPRHGSEHSLDALQSRYGRLPETVQAITGGGGVHSLFQHPGFRIRNDGAGLALGPGLDIRGDGGLFVAPPSLHLSGRNYEWELSSHPADVTVAAMPQWMSDLLLEHQSSTDRETEDTEDTEETEDTEATPVASVSPSLCLSVSQAIATTLPQREGERNRKLFDFARALRAVPTLCDKPLPQLKPAVREWHRAALPVIGTKAFDETWAEFAYAWPRVRSAMGVNPLAEALARVDAATLPPEASDYDSPATRRLLLLCRELQRASGAEPFFLSCRSAGGLLGIDHDAANKLLAMLVADGVLARARAGTTRTATRYRYVGGGRGEVAGA